MSDPNPKGYISDDDEDDDFVPANGPPNDGSDTENSEDSDAEPQAKRPKTDEQSSDPELKAKKEKERSDLWSQFKASVQSPAVGGPLKEPQKLIKIVKKFRYAGEDITQVVEVPEDSPEAKQWSKWEEPILADPQTTAARNVETNSTVPVALTHDDSQQPDKSEPFKPIAKKGGLPPPRKARKTLGDIPTSKGKKISTLDKSLMDWTSHVNTQENETMKDELEAHRKGGGYIEKVEFIQRVNERKDQEWEKNTSKRRRG